MLDSVPDSDPPILQQPPVTSLTRLQRWAAFLISHYRLPNIFLIRLPIYSSQAHAFFPSSRLTFLRCVLPRVVASSDLEEISTSSFELLYTFCHWHLDHFLAAKCCTWSSS